MAPSEVLEIPPGAASRGVLCTRVLVLDPGSRAAPAPRGWAADWSAMGRGAGVGAEGLLDTSTMGWHAELGAISPLSRSLRAAGSAIGGGVICAFAADVDARVTRRPESDRGGTLPRGRLSYPFLTRRDDFLGDGTRFPEPDVRFEIPPLGARRSARYRFLSRVSPDPLRRRVSRRCIDPASTFLAFPPIARSRGEGGTFVSADGGGSAGSGGDEGIGSFGRGGWEASSTQGGLSPKVVGRGANPVSKGSRNGGGPPAAPIHLSSSSSVE